MARRKISCFHLLLLAIWCSPLACIVTPAAMAQSDKADAAPSPDAKAEFQAAVDILKAHHLNRDKADWKNISAQGDSLIPAGKPAAEAYPSIQGVLYYLAIRHSYLIPADQVRKQYTAPASADTEGLRLPLSHIDGNSGYISLPTHSGSAASDTAYAQRLREALQQFQHKHICRIVIDLRENHGGNMWPMLRGLAPLLGQPPYGSFLNSDGPATLWDEAILKDGITAAPTTTQTMDTAFVAILIGPGTISSGEFTAMAFEGRPHSRFFGAPTGGFLTVNSSYPLPDGAILQVSSGWAADRTGHTYRDTISPDVATDKPQATAMQWLSEQKCRP